ncbi:MAG: cobalamin-dependent protein [Candidatus Kaelpia aquatica]|nr:cobalamin-dependent protein [Candidatus Kaelpia aquatica]
MKVSLINCPQSPYPYLYLGLPYTVSSVSIKHKVQLIDLAFCAKNYKKFILSEVQNDVPGVAAFSVNSANIDYAVEIARFLKQRHSSILIMFGGIYSTLLPEVMLRYSGVDAVCVGEGEEAFLEYLDRLEQDEEPFVQGIWYKKNNQEIIKNESRPFKGDLDSLPFPKRDIFGVSKYIKTSFFIPTICSFKRLFV